MAITPRLHLQTDRVRLYHGDAADIASVVAPESIDAIVTDPPSGIGFMGRSWDSDKGGRDHWIAWLAGIMRTALGLLKPGGHALVWALPRTSHWTATAVEDAGFEIRDVVMHLFGSGFPKSLDVSKAIDEAAGAVRIVATSSTMGAATEVGAIAINRRCDACGKARQSADPCRCPRDSGPVTPDAARWSGWGTALKPAAEHYILARKPLRGTVASNVIAFGTGAINVDGCRIGTDDDLNGGAYGGAPRDATSPVALVGRGIGEFKQPAGRWPAHLVLDEEAARVLDEQSGTLTSGMMKAGTPRGPQGEVYAKGFTSQPMTVDTYADTGGASRFFYVAKPARSEKDAGLDHLPIVTGGDATDREDGSAGLANPRAGAGRTGGARNFHPTVKSIDLMRWLCRLITPPGGTVLDLFTGSGSTGVAALREGFAFVGIERSPQPDRPVDADNPNYIDIAAGRLAHVACVAPPARVDGEPRAPAAQLSIFDLESPCT